MKLCGLVPNSYIHVSVSYLYIPRIGLPIWLQQKTQTDPGNIFKPLTDNHEHGNWEMEHYNSVLEKRRLRGFISGNTLIGIMHLYWILTGPSVAV
jgi:hypothetical protein